LTQHIIHTLVKATVFESVCHFRTQVSAIATHFLQTVFSTVHYMILLCQIPFIFYVPANAETHVLRNLFHLRSVEAVVIALFRHEFVVATAFCDTALVNVHDAVTVLNGGKSVRNDEGGSAL